MFNEFSSGDIVNGWYVFQDGIPLLSLGTSVLRTEATSYCKQLPPSVGVLRTSAGKFNPIRILRIVPCNPIIVIPDPKNRSLREK